jgi:hypothetical protein
MQCPTTKFLSFSFGIGFFFKYINYFAFIADFFLKTHIFNEFSTKTSKWP